MGRFRAPWARAYRRHLFCCLRLSTPSEKSWSSAWADSERPGPAPIADIYFAVCDCQRRRRRVGVPHGPIQSALGPRLSPTFILLFAIVNAVGEELEFRMLIFGGLLVQ